MPLTDEIRSWTNKKVLVIGEASLDKYIIGYADRISPDAPVPNVKIEKNLTYLGGIGLAIKFIKSLGGVPEICTIVGKDYEGNFFINRTKELEIDTSGIVIDETINTPQITRIKARDQHLIRLEKNYELNISKATIKRHFENIISRSPDIDAILLLDYGVGELNQDTFIHTLLKKLKDTYNAPIIARPNLNNYYLYEGVELIRMNLQKALRTFSIECCNDTSVSIVGKRILSTSHCRNVLLNNIKSDSYLFQTNKEHFKKFPSTLEIPVRSYVAVGSVLMAILALGYASGLSAIKAAQIALNGATLSAILPPVQFFSQDRLINYISKQNENKN